jgi:ribonuclease III
MEKLEAILKYRFTNRSLLEEAMTHPSIHFERKHRRSGDNQRLEFLGDAVLQLIFSELLYIEFSKGDEGVLSKTRATLVSTRSLAAIARQHGIGRFLILSHSEETSGGRDREGTLADAMEAILGAAYMDGGLEAAKTVLHALFGQRPLEHRPQDIDSTNPKGQLQELTQGLTTTLPVYQITHQTGPDHDRHFWAKADWIGETFGVGKGKTKREAEAEAAREAINNPRLREAITKFQANPAVAK